jgi:hypothetical protein
VPAALNVVQAQATMILATGFAAAFGTAALAGYGAAARLDLLQIPLTFAMGSAVIAMVATAVGAGRLDRARRIAWTGAGLGFLIGAIFAVVALALPETWMGLFSSDPATIAGGRGLSAARRRLLSRPRDRPRPLLLAARPRPRGRALLRRHDPTGRRRARRLGRRLLAGGAGCRCWRPS